MGRLARRRERVRLLETAGREAHDVREQPVVEWLSGLPGPELNPEVGRKAVDHLRAPTFLLLAAQDLNAGLPIAA